MGFRSCREKELGNRLGLVKGHSATSDAAADVCVWKEASSVGADALGFSAPDPIASPPKGEGVPLRSGDGVCATDASAMLESAEKAFSLLSPLAFLLLLRERLKREEHDGVVDDVEDDIGARAACRVYVACTEFCRHLELAQLAELPRREEQKVGFKHKKEGEVK